MKTMFKKSVSDSFWAMIIAMLALLELLGSSGCGIQEPTQKPQLNIVEQADHGVYWFRVGVLFPPDKEPPTLRNVTPRLENLKFTTWEESRGDMRMLTGEFDDNSAHPPEGVNLIVQANALWAEGPVSYGRHNGTLLHHFRVLLPEPREASCTTPFEGDFRTRLSLVGESLKQPGWVTLGFKFPNGVEVTLEATASGIVSLWRFSGALQVERDQRSIDCTIDH